MTLSTASSRIETATSDELSTNFSKPESCPPSNFTDDQLLSLTIERWFLGFEFFFAVIGNVFILGLLWKRRVKWSKMHLFILHLAIADLLVAFFLLLPEWFIRVLCGFHAGDAACRLHKFMQIVAMYGSTFVLLAAGFDRYRAICHPMKSFRSSRKRVYFTVAAMWIISAFLATPQLVVFTKLETYKACVQPEWVFTHPYFNKIYVTWFLVVILIVPTILLSYLYGMIALMIMRNLSEKKRAAVARNGTTDESETLTRPNNRNGSFAPRASSTTGISKAKIKTVKMTAVIVVTYIVCWTPFFVVNMLYGWGYQVASVPFNIFQLLGCLNSCTNPWIYMCFSGNLYNDLKQIVCCIKKKENSFSLKPTTFYANQSNPNSSALMEATTEQTSYSMDSPTLRRKACPSEQLQMAEYRTALHS